MHLRYFVFTHYTTPLSDHSVAQMKVFSLLSLSSSHSNRGWDGGYGLGVDIEEKDGEIDRDNKGE